MAPENTQTFPLNDADLLPDALFAASWAKRI
jgi:hypothetical protein